MAAYPIVERLAAFRAVDRSRLVVVGCARCSTVDEVPRRDVQSLCGRASDHRHDRPPAAEAVISAVRGSNQLPSAFSVACSPSDHAIRDTTPVHRLPALLRILDVLGEPLKEDFGRDSSPAAGMVMGVVTEVPKLSTSLRSTFATAGS